MDDTPRSGVSAGGRIGDLLYRSLDRIVGAFEAVLLIGCGLAIVVAMIVTTIDVILRYGFANPLGWSFDFINLYMLPAAYYLAFAYAMRVGAHLSVDFFSAHLPERLVRPAYLVFLILSAALVGYVSWLVLGEAWSAFASGSVLFGSIQWPTWPTEAIIAGSFLVLAARLPLVAYHHAFLNE